MVLQILGIMVAMTPADALILILGPAGAGKQTLLARLIHPSRPAAAGSSTLKLNNKYYSADVTIQTCTLDTVQQSQLDAAQGIVLVFDATQQASFTAVQGWAEQNDPAAAEVDQCTSSSRPAWLQASQQWCLQNMWEYCEACPADPQADALLVVDGSAQGIQRILEALQAHMWPGLTLKNGRGGQASGGADNSSQDAGHGGLLNDDGLANRNGLHTAELASALPSARQEQDSIAQAQPDTAQPAHPPGLHMPEEPSSLTLEEKEMEQYESMFKELAGHSALGDLQVPENAFSGFLTASGTRQLLT
eukprot:jgi/Astpho2/5179/Aster-x1278